MAQFDQRGQRVTSQYNVGRDMNVGATQTSQDLIALLEQLKEQTVQAKAAGLLSDETATNTEHQGTKAILPVNRQGDNP